jgi:hypothetical protein
MTGRNGRTAFATAVSLSFLAACAGGDGGGNWSGTVTDSAGVEIVMNPQAAIWAADESPAVVEELRIGSAAGEAEYQFGQIASIDVGADGTIFVLDQQSQHIRAFDAQGAYLRTIGRPGSGPGELSPQAVFLVVTRGDTLLVPDLGQQRVTRYTADGTVLGSFPIPLAEGIPVRWLVGPEGRIVQQARIMALPGQTTQVEPKDLLLERDAAGEILDTIMVLPGGEQVKFTETSVQMRLFEAEPVWGLGAGGAIYFAMNSDYSIGQYSSGGDLVRLIRKDVPRKAVTEMDKTAILDAMRDLYSRQGIPPEAVDGIMGAVDFADYYPAFANLMGGPGGSLWVQRLTSAQDVGEGAEFDVRDIGSPVWDVFGSDGRYLGEATLPARFQPLRVIDNTIWGVWRDDLDVQYVLQLHVDIESQMMPMEGQTDD